MSIKIRIDERVISFKGDSAVICDQSQGWDVDFMDLADDWIHQLESESDYLFYLRMVDNKFTKILYFQGMRWEDGEYETYCIDPIVVWITNKKDFAGVTVLKDSYPLQEYFQDDDDEEHDDD